MCSSTSLRGRRQCRVLPFPTAHLGRERSPARPTAPPRDPKGCELQTHSGPRRDPLGKEDVRVRTWVGGLHHGEERRGQGPRAESQEDCSGRLLPVNSSPPARTAVPREPGGFPQPRPGAEREGRVRSVPYPIRTNAHRRRHV